MTFSWVRSIGGSSTYEVGQFLLGKLDLGQSYVRVHFRWGVYGDTTNVLDISSVAANAISFGLVTTIGDGTETAPNARTNSDDVDPPTQRWIYWETRLVVPSIISTDGGVIIWKDSGPTEPTDTKGQVLATGFAPGPTLNLWATWAAEFAWDPSGIARVWAAASVLYKTP